MVQEFWIDHIGRTTYSSPNGAQPFEGGDISTTISLDSTPKQECRSSNQDDTKETTHWSRLNACVGYKGTKLSYRLLVLPSSYSFLQE